MGINKIVYGGVTKLDISNDTVTPSSLLQGYTAHDNTGTLITGTASAPSLQTKTKTYSPTTSKQTETVTADNGYDGLQSVAITVNAMPSGTAGTPTASKGTVSNHSVSVTPSVTNTTGYISGGTKTGTAVTVSASELVSGTKTVTTTGTSDVTNYASVNVDISFSTIYSGTSDPSSSLGVNGDIYLKVVG